MADIGKGAKAGALAGIVSGIILAIAYYVLFSLVLAATIRAAIQANAPLGGYALTVDAIVAAAMIALVIGTFVGAVIGGIILGIIFAFVEPKFMKSASPTMKGLIFGIVLWIIGIISNLGNFYYGTAYVAASIVIGLVGSLIFGYLLGRFYGTSGPKMPPGQTMPASGTGMTQ